MVAKVNPPPLKIPKALQEDREVAGPLADHEAQQHFSDLQK